MKMKGSFWLWTAVGTAMGAGVGMAMGKTFCKSSSIKKSAGKALHAAGTFVEHLNF